MNVRNRLYFRISQLISDYIKGCLHNREDAGISLAYAHGYRDPKNRFRSILAYDCKRGCPRRQRFSNIQYRFDGRPMGTSQNDNARQINNVAYEIAGYYPSKTLCAHNDDCDGDLICDSMYGICTPIPTPSPSTQPSAQPSLKPSMGPTLTMKPTLSLAPSQIPTLVCLDLEGSVAVGGKEVDCKWVLDKDACASLDDHGVPLSTLCPVSCDVPCTLSPTGYPSRSAVPSSQPSGSQSLAPTMSLQPSTGPSIGCKDLEGSVAVGGKEVDCKWVHDKDACAFLDDHGVPLSTLCPVSCDVPCTLLGEKNVSGGV